ncbi:MULTISPECIES: hypothetical protein [Nocardia]|uniref:hypothetical protein n=1 Tax=Nocardia TaxID=1817 RepID=UPI000A8ED19B|nr:MULTISPECIES: hypothetical protein [Nocardia]
MSNESRSERRAAREYAWRLLQPDNPPRRSVRRISHLFLDLLFAVGYRGERARVNRIIRELGDQTSTPPKDFR